MVLKFCANISFMFQECGSLLERYDLAKQAGFKAVECAFPYDFPLKEVAEKRTQNQLLQVLINAFPGDWSKGERGLAAIPGKEAEFKSGLELSIKYAQELKCKRIHIMAGIVEKESSEHMKTFKNNLMVAAEMLSENKIIGVIEPINKYSISNYFLDNYEKATSVIQEIDSPYMKLQLDLYHMQHICGNLTRNIQALLPLIGHIQVAQVPDRHEPNTPGEIDYKYMFKLLEELGYNEWIGLEYYPKMKTVDGLSWINEYGYTF